MPTPPDADQHARSRIELNPPGRHATSEVVEASPRPDLRTYVDRYVGYRDAQGSVRRRELPSPTVTLIVSFGHALHITDPRTGGTTRRTSFAAGLHDHWVFTETMGQEGVQINLTPVGAYTILGVPMNELTNHAVELASILGTGADDLAFQLAELPTWEDRFHLLDHVLANRMTTGHVPAPTTRWVWNRIRETSGKVEIETLVRELGCSRKHISERFRVEVGITPKSLARLSRFDRAVGLLRRGENALADIAVSSGYYDQAHLNREVREFAGVSPLTLGTAFRSSAV